MTNPIRPRAARRRSSARARVLAAGAFTVMIAAPVVHGQAQTDAPTTAGATPTTALSLSPNSAQQGWTGSVLAGATYSDNVDRNPTNKQGSTSADVGVTFDDYENRPNFRSNVAADVEYQRYSNALFPSRWLGGVAGDLGLTFVPEHFGWTFTDNFGQTRTNSLQVETPSNRQNVNVFTTGPDLMMPLGSSTSLDLDGRYTRASYQNTLADNSQYGGTLGLAERLSATERVSLAVSSQHFEFDSSAQAASYDVRSAYVEFDATGRRTTLRLQGGYTQLHRVSGNTGEPLVSIVLDHLLTPRTHLSIDAGANYSDSGQQFRLAQLLGGVVLGSNDTVIATDPLRAKHAGLGWTFSGERTSVKLRGAWESERHEVQQALNRDVESGALTITRRVSTDVSLTLGGNYERQDFTEVRRTVDDWAAELSMSWTLARHWSLRAAAGHYGGTGLPPLGAPIAFSYSENRASLFLSFGKFR